MPEAGGAIGFQRGWGGDVVKKRLDPFFFI